MTPIQGVWVADDFFNELGLFRAAAVETIVSAPGIIPYFALFQNVALADVGDAECVIFYLPIQDRVNPHILCVRHFDNQFLNTVSVQIHEGVRKVFPIAEAIQNIRNIRRVGVRVGNKSIGLSKFHQRNPLYFLLWMGVHDASGFRFRDGLCVFGTAVQTSVPLVRLRIVDNTGQEFRAFSILLKEEVKNIQRTAELLLEVNLGATAIGTGLNTPKEYSPLAVKKLAEVTGFPCVPAEDLIEATSDCGAYVMVHGALKRLAVKMSKICNDLRLLSSGPRAGLNEINLPELQAGSSIMPAKVNPVVPEVVNQVCFKVIGNDTTVTMAAEAGQLQLNVMEPVIGQAMFESVHILTNACYNLLEKCINGITANKEVCEGYVYNSIGIVTYLNPFIGHHNGDIVGKICAETGKSVREVVLERGLLTEAELDDIFSVQNLMHPAYKAKRYTDESEQ